MMVTSFTLDPERWVELAFKYGNQINPLVNSLGIFGLLALIIVVCIIVLRRGWQERADDRKKHFELMTTMVEAAKQDTKECRDAAKAQVEQSTLAAAEKDARFTATLENIVDKNLIHISKLESRVYEALTTGRAMAFQLEETAKRVDVKLKEIAPEGT